MVDRITGPSRGVPHRGPEPKKEISRELKTNVNDTKHVAQNLSMTKFGAKIDGYSKGPANPAEAKKTTSVVKKHMPRGKV